MSRSDLPLPGRAGRGNLPAHIDRPTPPPSRGRTLERERAASGRPLGWAHRLSLAAAAAGIVAVLGTAAVLRPDPRGHGTHTQLGLAPCNYFRMTGRRCPACGMTTAFAWAVRGRLDRAWGANPAGALLAPASVALVPWLIACAASGRPRWGAGSIDGPLMILVLAAAAVGLGAWTLRMILGRVFG